MIVFWHGVSLEDEHKRFRDLFISAESLRERLDFIAKNYNVISMDEAMRQHAQGKFQERQVVLTFDDGHYNFAARAAPILKEYGMTATVYLTTFYVDKQLPVPILLLRDAVLLAPKQDIHLTCLELSEPFRLHSLADRARLTRLVMTVFRGLPPEPEMQISFVSKLARDLGVDISQLIRRRVWHRMNEEEVRGMSQQGFAVEAHGHRHLSVVDHAGQTEDEVRACCDRIRAVTRKDPVHFCYPSGRWNRKAWQALTNAGIRSAVTGAEGPNYPETPPLALRRVSNGESRCQLEFEFEMSNIKYLIHSLLKPDERYTPPERYVAGKSIEEKVMT